MIIDLLTIVGLTTIITMSQIFRPIREWITKKSLFFGRLISCSLCTGTWAGLSFFFIPEFAKPVLAYMALGAIASEALYLIFKRLEIR
jgi:hypothetical protein